MTLKYDIDWEIVNKHLICPQCGEKGFLNPGTDGTQAFHTHHWVISEEMAQSITKEHRTPIQQINNLIKTTSPEYLEAVLMLLKKGETHDK